METDQNTPSAPAAATDFETVVTRPVNVYASTDEANPDIVKAVEQGVMEALNKFKDAQGVVYLHIENLHIHTDSSVGKRRHHRSDRSRSRGRSRSGRSRSRSGNRKGKHHHGHGFGGGFGHGHGHHGGRHEHHGGRHGHHGGRHGHHGGFGYGFWGPPAPPCFYTSSSSSSESSSEETSAEQVEQVQKKDKKREKRERKRSRSRSEARREHGKKYWKWVCKMQRKADKAAAKAAKKKGGDPQNSNGSNWEVVDLTNSGGNETEQQRQQVTTDEIPVEGTTRNVIEGELPEQFNGMHVKSP